MLKAPATNQLFCHEHMALSAHMAKLHVDRSMVLDGLHDKWQPYCHKPLTGSSSVSRDHAFIYQYAGSSPANSRKSLSDLRFTDFSGFGLGLWPVQMLGL